MSSLGATMFDLKHRKNAAAITRYLDAGKDAFITENITERTLLMAALLDASPKKSLELIKRLLAAQLPVNSADAEGYTALMVACKSDNLLPHSQTLLTAGASHAVWNKAGEQALHIAVAAGCKAQSKLLISVGADVNAFSNKMPLETSPYPVRGPTCLMIAARNDKPELIALLAAAGAEVNFVYGKGNEQVTALLLSCVHSSSAAFSALVKAGASLSPSVNLPALWHAVRNNNASMVRTLLAAGASPDLILPGLDPPCSLMLAAKNNKPELIALLAAAGAHLDLSVRKGGETITAVVLAAAHSSHGALHALEIAGAHLSAKVNHPALWHAVRNNNELIVRALLIAGVPASFLMPGKECILSMAVQNAQVDILRVLIENGIDVNSRYESITRGSDISCEITPLLQCCYIPNTQQRMQVANLLLDAGAAVSTKGGLGQTALHASVTIQKPGLEFTELLIDRGADLEACDENAVTPLVGASYAGTVEQIQCLLKAGANIEHLQKGGCTPLSAAIENADCINVMTAMLDHGANVHAENEKGYTPLDEAIQLDNIPATKLLLDRGANIEHRNEMGMSPLFSVQSLPMLKLLIEAGADIHALNNLNMNTLHCAVARKPAPQIALVCGLIKAGIDVKLTCAPTGAHFPKSASFLAKEAGHLKLSQLLDGIAAQSSSSNGSSSSSSKGGSNKK